MKIIFIRCFFVVTVLLFGHASIIYLYSNMYASGICPSYDLFCFSGQNLEHVFPKVENATEWLIRNDKTSNLIFVKNSLLSISTNTVFCLAIVTMLFGYIELAYGHKTQRIGRWEVLGVPIMGMAGVYYIFFENMFEMGKAKSVLYAYPVYIYREAFLALGVLFFWYGILLIIFDFFKMWNGMKNGQDRK